MRKIFSIPLNPKLTNEQYIEFVNFIGEYKDHIKDVYFTCRIAPFAQDAMGDIFVEDDDYKLAIEQALFVQQQTGVPVSATFNNIQVKTLNLFTMQVYALQLFRIHTGWQQDKYKKHSLNYT